MAAAFEPTAFNTDAFEGATASPSLALAATEGADASAMGIGLRVSSSLAATEGADTTAMNAAAMVVGAMSVVEGADTFASNVSLLITAAMAAEEPADLASLEAEYASAGVSAELAATEGADLAECSMDSPIGNTFNNGGRYRNTGSIRVEDDDEYENGFLRAVPKIVPLRTVKVSKPAKEYPVAKPIVREVATNLVRLKIAALEAKREEERRKSRALRILLLAS